MLNKRLVIATSVCTKNIIFTDNAIRKKQPNPTGTAGVNVRNRNSSREEEEPWIFL
jgi:hypothetical protein